MPERIISLGPNHRIIVDDTLNIWKLQFYDTTAAVWKDIMAYKTDDQTISLDPRIRKSIPSVRFSGTEAGAKDLSIRQNAGRIELFDNVAGVVPTDWDLSPKLSFTELKPNTVQFEIPVELFPNAPVTIAADAAASTRVINPVRYLVSNILKKHLKSAFFEVSVLSGGGNHDWELYDITAGLVRASIRTIGAGDWPRLRSDAIDLAGLVVGNEIAASTHVVASGAAGTTKTWRSAKLILIYGVS